jgi:hypothetical protein
VENSNKNEYEKTRSNFTYLEPSAADWIVNHDIKCVGIDTLSIERKDFTEGIIHKKLLSHDIGIIENLDSNLRRFVDKKNFFIRLPLLFEDLDGSPARAIVFDIMYNIRNDGMSSIKSTQMSPIVNHSLSGLHQSFALSSLNASNFTGDDFLGSH